MGFGARSFNPGDVLPPTVPVVTATRTGPQEITVTWGASSDASGVARYYIREYGVPSSEVEVIGPNRSRVYSGLAANTAFRYEVRAQDIYGNISLYGASALVSTLPINVAPVWSVVPAWSLPYNTGGTRDVKPYVADANGDPITISLVNPPAGYTISNGVINATASVVAATLTLSASDGLLTATTTMAVTVASAIASPLKFHPGHYMTVFDWAGGGNTQAGRFAMYDSIENESAVKGVNFMMRYGWKECESSFGVYTLDWLQQELDYLWAHGQKRMMLWMGFGAFGITWNSGYATAACPAYAANNTTYGNGFVAVNGGGAGNYAMWVPAMNARWIEMCKAIGTRFDSHPALEAFRPFHESSYSVVGMASGEHEPALLQSISTTLLAIKPYFPTTMLFSCVSWIRNIGTLFPIFAANGFGAGGTDEFPVAGYPGNATWISGKGPTDSDDVYEGRGDDQGNQAGTSYLGVIPYWNDNEDPVYYNYKGFRIPSEIYASRMGRRQTHHTWTRMWDPVNYMSGFNRTDMTESQYRTAVQWPTGILPFIRANPTTWTTPPSSILTNFKWHPGHYVIPDAHLTPSGEAAYTSLWSQIAGASISRIAGGAVTAVWGQVETAQGVYNFDAIDRQISALAAQGRKCGINILTAKYTSGEPSTSTTPAYFPAYAITGGLVAQFGGYYQCVKYYRAAAMDRVIALFQAFANRYENDPRVAWIGTPETSLGGGIVDSDNTETNQRTQWLRLNAALQSMYVRTPVAMMNNFLWSQNSTGILTQDIVDRKLVQAGPDIFLSSSESDESWGLKYLRGQRWNGSTWAFTGPDQRDAVGVIVNQEVVRYSNATPQLYYQAAVDLNKQTHLLWAIKGTVYLYGHYLDPAYRIPAMDGVNVLNYLRNNDLPLRVTQPPR